MEQLPDEQERPSNLSAFPPVHLDVQVPRSTGRARAAIPGGQMSEVRAMQEKLPDALMPRTHGCGGAADG
ncbi:MAG: hypothetical protein O7B27_02995, partial [Gammaproteobacteria bacterium]|nr:hypothetical protein [Gammaproteobacteria bacterium]